MHHRVPKSKRHKKIKGLEALSDQESDHEDLDKRRFAKERQRLVDLSRQKMPRKMQEMLERKEAMEKGSKKRKPKKALPGLLALRVTEDSDVVGSTRETKWMPGTIQQGPYETEEQFLKRLERLSSRAVAEAKIEQKFDVDFCPKVLSTKTGGEKDMSGDGFGDKKRAKRRLRDAKRREKKRTKKSKDSGKDFKDLKDEFVFGETVMRPPMLQKRKKLKSL